MNRDYTIDERISLIEEQLPYLSEEHTDMAVKIIDDLTLYPYIGDKYNSKYKFNHAGFSCHISRCGYDMTWNGYIDLGLELDNIDFEYIKKINATLPDNIGLNINGISTSSLNFRCGNCDDINPRSFLYQAIQRQNIGKKLNGNYYDYEQVIEEAKILLSHLSTLDEI